MRKFHGDGITINFEKIVHAESLYAARVPFLGDGYPARCIYILDITQ